MATPRWQILPLLIRKTNRDPSTRLTFRLQSQHVASQTESNLVVLPQLARPSIVQGIGGPSRLPRGICQASRGTDSFVWTQAHGDATRRVASRRTLISGVLPYRTLENLSFPRKAYSSRDVVSATRAGDRGPWAGAGVARAAAESASLRHQRAAGLRFLQAG
jgi:hypothetical protein